MGVKAAAPFYIEPLGEHHDRAAFSCGVAPLDDYLKRQARQQRDRRVAAVFVMVGDTPETVAGYFTLSALSIGLASLPAGLAKKLPRYPEVPAALIGRLAVDRRYQERRLGELLLMDALHRIAIQSEVIGVYAAVVDAIDDRAATFYESYGFMRFPGRRDRLFLPTATILRMFA